MKKEEIQALIEKQRLYYLSGETLDVQYRINALKTLKTAILKYEQEIEEALKKDLGKSYFESYMCEVGLSLSEISYMIKHTRSFSYTFGTICLSKLYKTKPLWCNPHHESLELSIYVNDRTSS